MGKAEAWPWENPVDWNHRRDAHIQGIALAVKIILDHEKELLPEILKGWWKEVLFKATEIPDKYHTRYYSKGVLEVLKLSPITELSPVELKQKLIAHIRENNEDELKIQHDHVRSRDWLKKELSKQGAEIKNILSEAEIIKILSKYAWGCVLTKREHQKLKNEPQDGDGGKDDDVWGKYHRAEVEVFDLLEKKMIPKQ